MLLVLLEILMLPAIKSDVVDGHCLHHGVVVMAGVAWIEVRRLSRLVHEILGLSRLLIVVLRSIVMRVLRCIILVIHPLVVRLSMAAALMIVIALLRMDKVMVMVGMISCAHILTV